MAENLAAGFLSKGLSTGQDTHIGIFCQNRPEWIITEQACFVYNMVSVPLYDTLGADACCYIISQSSMKLIICDTANRAAELVKKHDKCPDLQYIVIMESVLPEDLTLAASENGLELIAFDALINDGAALKFKWPPEPPRPDDLCTICYTSGTTGIPKGVMLTHSNVISNTTCLSLLKYTKLTTTDIMISFLPLAHMFERLLETVCYSIGARVGFYRGDVKLLTDDIRELKPTIVPVVPRLLNRIYDKVMQDVGGSTIKKLLFGWALKSKEKEVKNLVIRNDSIWDKFVFKRIREGMGGKVRLMITGSAPLAENILTFMRAAMGCIVIEGYGQTETAAACSVTLEGDAIPGHVGPPFPCCKIKLIDVPEMEYYAKNGKGEICVKGYNVFKGYYADPEKTKEALDEDGWLRSGDIGQWTKQGTLKLIDRRKHIFKLAQGEYIAPEKIENVYINSKYVAQVFVHGESLKSCLIAVVVPDEDVLVNYAKKQGLTQSLSELCKDENIKKMILNDMTRQGKDHGLFSFEQVKDIHLYPELWSVENNLLTPTYKSKRPQLLDLFRPQIADMYKLLT